MRPFPPIRVASALVVPLTALFLGTPSALAVERVTHVLDERSGLSVAETSLLAQDSRGFLWIGTIGGVYRFDGSEIRAWAPEQVRHVVKALAAGLDGQVVVAGESEPLWEVTSTGVEATVGPRGGEIRDWIDAEFSGDGALWVATRDTLWRRPPGVDPGRGTEWGVLPGAAFGKDDRPGELFRLHPIAGDSLFVATRTDLWVAHGDGRVRRVAPIPLALAAEPLGNGLTAVLSARGDVWYVGGGSARLAHSLPPGGADLAVRNGTIWVTQGRALSSITPDGRVRSIPPSQGVPPGRPLLVDREGTLWIGGLRGLVGLPEPETVAWNELDGLPDPPHAHHIARGQDAIWVVTWFGSVRLRESEDGPPTIESIGTHSGRIRSDPGGRMWAADLEAGFLRWDPGADAPIHFSRPGVHGLYGTSPRADGTLWMATDDGLFLAPTDDAAPTFLDVPTPPSIPGGWRESWLGPCLEDSRGRFWVGHGEEVLSCDADSLARGLPVTWKTFPLPGIWKVHDMIELPEGEIWFGTGNAGILQLERDLHRERLVPLGGNRALASLRIYGLVPSPSGGAWVLAAGSLVRVVPRPDLADGWEIVERLGAWQGLPAAQAGDLQEDPDGRLWLASLAGLIEVSPEARRTSLPSPAVELVVVGVDGERLPTDREARLSSRQNRIEVRFAALSFREHGLLRYQYRLHPRDGWQESREPRFSFVELAPGRYRAEVRASLDGVHWTPSPCEVDFSVAAPWWRTPQALLLFALAAGALLYAIHRTRVALLLQLERQRRRIAMDLHDEIGSGLGGIGILAGLAADEQVEEGRRRELSARIGESSTELGGALGEIVKSIEHGADTIESFALRLVARARRMVPGDSPRLVLEFPERWPEVRLSPKVQRELQAIATEALHNAVRHSGAGRLELSLMPDRDRWKLRVRDDGVGLLDRDGETGGRRVENGSGTAPGRPPSERGHGLVNMQTRAAEIHAEINWTCPPGGGTSVEIRFHPRGRRSLRMTMRARSRHRSDILSPR